MGRRGGERVQLKNGTEIDARWGLAELTQLKYFFDQDTDVFDALLAVAQGRPGEVPAAGLDYLREASFLDDHDVLNEATRNVLLSAYRATPEGAVLVNPFRLHDRNEAIGLENMLDEKQLRRLRKMYRDGPGPGPGRGRE